MAVMIRSKNPIELVVARYAEDLRWLRRVPAPFGITIYNKGGSCELPCQLAARSEVRLLSLPNIGREAHSYLMHLLEYYDDLAPVTVFAQGHPFDHAPDFHQSIRELAMEGGEPDSFSWYGFLDETDDPLGHRLFVPWSKNPERRELSTGRLYEELFHEPSPPLFHFRCGAQFAVTKETVRKRPREFYERALRLSIDIPHAAHSLERIWDRVFGAPIIDPAMLGDEGVRYWKRIRRMENGQSGKWHGLLEKR